jgi:hypothetical protein
MKFTFFAFYIFSYGSHVVSVCINSYSISFPLYFYGFCTDFKVVHLYVARSMASVPHAPPHNKCMQKPQISTSFVVIVIIIIVVLLVVIVLLVGVYRK